MEPLVALRERLKQTADPVPTYNDLIIKAVALTLRAHPRLNAWCDDEKLMLLDDVNVGFAVGTPAGVLLPTVRGRPQALVRSRRSRAEMVEAGARGAAAGLAADGRRLPSPTWVQGIDCAPIISHPRWHLGVGSFKPQPMVIEARSLRAPPRDSLVVDHRAIDGAEGAVFLAALAGSSRTPSAWRSERVG